MDAKLLWKADIMQFFLKLIVLLTAAATIQLGIEASWTIKNCPVPEAGSATSGSQQLAAISSLRSHIYGLNPVARWIFVNVFNLPFDTATWPDDPQLPCASPAVIG